MNYKYLYARSEKDSRVFLRVMIEWVVRFGLRNYVVLPLNSRMAPRVFEFLGGYFLIVVGKEFFYHFGKGTCWDV